MPKASNIHFVRSSKIKASEVLSLHGISIWSACDATFSRIDALCGEGVSRLFAEPNVKSQGGSDLLNVAWFGSYDDDPKEIGALDRAKLSRVEEDLIQRLEAIRPALRDPEIGDTVAAMLNVYGDDSIMAVGEHAILTNWGALPPDATSSEAVYAKHSDATIGRFLKTDMAARLPGRPWTNSGTIEPDDHSPGKRGGQPLQPATTMPPTTTFAGYAPQRWRWWVPAVLVALFGSILAYTAWPGNLVYERESPIDEGVLSQLEDANGSLTQNIALLETEIGKDACDIDPALVDLPPREAATTTQTRPAVQQGESK